MTSRSTRLQLATYTVCCFCLSDVTHLALNPSVSVGQMAASVASRRIGTPLGQTLAGKRVLVFGLGNIGVELLPR